MSWADQHKGMKAYYDKKMIELLKKTLKTPQTFEKESLFSEQDPDDTYAKYKDSEFDNSSYRLL